MSEARQVVPQSLHLSSTATMPGREEGMAAHRWRGESAGEGRARTRPGLVTASPQTWVARWVGRNSRKGCGHGFLPLSQPIFPRAVVGESRCTKWVECCRGVPSRCCSALFCGHGTRRFRAFPHRARRFPCQQRYLLHDKLQCSCSPSKRHPFFCRLLKNATSL
jgi:hypothetical protein